MISKEHIKYLLTDAIAGTDIFMVEIKISNDNKIAIYIDTPQGILIEDCIKISRAIESGLDREIEDFELEVSSPGLSHPFKVIEQYYKHLNKDIEVLKNDSIKLKGKLLKVEKDFIEIEEQKQVKDKKTKKKQLVINKHVIPFLDIKQVKTLLIFK